MVNAFEHYYSPLVKWSFLGERHEIFDNAYEAQHNVLIKVQCFYEGDDLHLVCSNAFNYEPGTSNMDAITRYISNSISDNAANKIPSSQLLYNHIFGTGTYDKPVNNIHVRAEDRESWESHVADSRNNYIWVECVKPEEERARYHFGHHEKQTWWEQLQHRVDNITVESGSSQFINLIDSIEQDKEYEGIDNREFLISLNVSGAITKEEQKPACLISTDTLRAHAFGNDTTGVLHTNAEEKSKWDGKLDNAVGDDFIKVTPVTEWNKETDKVETKISLRTVKDIESTEIDDLNTTVPTTDAVKQHVH